MVSQGTLWCLGITAATAVGIWIIHEQQTEEREVRRGAVAFLRANRCLPRTEHRLNMVQQRQQSRALRVQAAAAALRRCLLPCAHDHDTLPSPPHLPCSGFTQGSRETRSCTRLRSRRCWQASCSRHRRCRCRSGSETERPLGPSPPSPDVLHLPAVFPC